MRNQRVRWARLLDVFRRNQQDQLVADYVIFLDGRRDSYDTSLSRAFINAQRQRQLLLQQQLQNQQELLQRQRRREQAERDRVERERQLDRERRERDEAQRQEALRVIREEQEMRVERQDGAQKCNKLNFRNYFDFEFRFRVSISSFDFEFRFRVSISSFDFEF